MNKPFKIVERKTGIERNCDEYWVCSNGGIMDAGGDDFLDSTHEVRWWSGRKDLYIGDRVVCEKDDDIGKVVEGGIEWKMDGFSDFDCMEEVDFEFIRQDNLFERIKVIVGNDKAVKVMEIL